MRDSPEQQDPRVYFAAERTFLAWIRTGLALMGIGFAVARFGLFLREMQASGVHAGVHSTGLSEWSGVSLVVVGVLVNVNATVRHVVLVHELKSGEWKPGISTSAVLLALILALVGVAMAVYLMVIH